MLRPRCQSVVKLCNVVVREFELMKSEEVRQKTNDELQDQLDDFEKEAFNLRFQKASGQLENTVRVREVRRDIARIKTILHERRGDLSRGAN